MALSGKERCKRWYHSPKGAASVERRTVQIAAARRKYYLEKDKPKRQTKEWRDKRRAHRTKKSGLSGAEYQHVFHEQQGRCAACNRHQSEFRRAFSSDHNHKTGEMRGLLCDNCNFAIGHAGESIERLRQLISYLEKWDSARAIAHADRLDATDDGKEQ